MQKVEQLQIENGDVLLKWLNLKTWEPSHYKDVVKQSNMFYPCFSCSKNHSQQVSVKLLLFFTSFNLILSYFSLFIFYSFIPSSFDYFNNILMTEFAQPFQRSQEIFLNYINEIQEKKIGEISVRRAIKKYDVKNLKINNVTPLRAKKMYSAISSKYFHGITTDKSWLENERRLFIWCTLCYLYKNELEIQDLKLEDFQFLQQMFPLKELNLIKFQIYSLVKKNNKDSGWTKEENALLTKLVIKQNDKNIEWSNISKQFFIQSQEKYFRNAKQCRERWLNYLDPNKCKEKWKKEQDVILLKEVLEKGKKWSRIVESLEGKKNQHMIKNRYKSLIHKKQKTCKNSKIKENEIIKLILKDYKDNEQQLSEDRNEDESKIEEQEKVPGKQKEEDSELEYSDKQSEKQQQFIKQQHNDNNKNGNFFRSCQNWPIIIQAASTDRQKITDNDRDNCNQIQVYGTKADKEFVNNLFFSVSTPGVEQNRFFPGALESRSPQGFLHGSPFQQSCWTPSIVFSEDPQVQSSPLGFDFSSTARNFTSFIQKR